MEFLVKVGITSGIISSDWKKRRYWKNNVDREAVKEYFYGKGVGYADTISRVIYGQHLRIRGMEKPDYTIMLTTTYETLEWSGNERKWRAKGGTLWFKYPYIVWNQYIYWYAVDDHNNFRQPPIRI